MQISSINFNVARNTNFGLTYGKETAKILDKSRNAAAKKGPKELAAWDNAKKKLDNCIVVKNHNEDYLLCHTEEGWLNRRDYRVVTPFTIDYNNPEGFGYGVLTTSYDELLTKKNIEKIIDTLTNGPYSVKYDENYYDKYSKGFTKIPNEYYNM